MYGLLRQGGVELIEKLRNDASSYNAWVTVLDNKGKPNNGPFEASRTIIAFDRTTGKPTDHFDYFLSGHFLKFIQRGAVRVESTAGTRDVANAAFRNPDGSMVLVLVNAGNRGRSFSLQCACRRVTCRLTCKSVATLVWPQP